MVREVAVAVPLVLNQGTISGESGRHYQVVQPKIVVVQSRKHPNLYVLPKGGIEIYDGSSASAAKREAYEEAGVSGRIHERAPLVPRLKSPSGKNVAYHIHLLIVDNLADTWPESHQRQRLVLDIHEALSLTSWREEIAACKDIILREISRYVNGL